MCFMVNVIGNVTEFGTNEHVKVSIFENIKSKKHGALTK